MRLLFPLILICAPAVASTGGVFDGADVIFLGELHDNPGHHARQADIVSDIEPSALVFEMLTPDQAALITPALTRDEAALEATLGWNESGWPDFSMYFPIFAAAPEAAYFGAAVPRETAMAAMQSGVIGAFEGDAAQFGLSAPLPDDQQTEREALQLAAHCDAMPAEMLPVMVDIQRLRDAELALAAAKALNAHGAPVVVITGNGHARKDWGAPLYLRTALPEIRIVSLGQAEGDNGTPEGSFDIIESSPSVDRGDPCEAFR